MPSQVLRAIAVDVLNGAGTEPAGQHDSWMDNDIAVPSRYYVRLCPLLVQRGFDPYRLLAEAGISLPAIEGPDATLRLSQVDRFVTEVVRIAGPGAAIDLGKTLSASTHSIVGFGMLSSPNVERAMQFLARFFQLVMASFSMRYSKRAGGADLIWIPVVGMSADCLAFHLESIASAAYTEVTELSRQLPKFRVALSIAEPAHRRRYAELSGAQWRFGMGLRPAVRIAFDYDLSRFPLALADSGALRVAESRCNALAGQVAATGSYKGWVTMMLREAGDGHPSLGDLATVLNLSPRTLGRYLESESVSFRELVAELRFQRACFKLAQRKVRIVEVAHSLGFGDAANFTRFFRRHAGSSPREYHRKAQGLQGLTPA